MTFSTPLNGSGFTMTHTMHGKKILITGGNSGIGFETAKALIAQGAAVVIASRASAKTDAALTALGPSARHLAVDLSDLSSVRALADAYLAEYQQLDVLINNAGLFPAKQQMTQQGFEMQFGVNHLSHFLLSQLLLPLMLGQPSARIITVSSMLHQKAKLDFASFKGAAQYSGQRAYGQSKLANVLFAFELAERLSGTQVTSNALHPGGVATDIVRDLPWLVRKLLGLVFITPEEGAKTSILLASDPSLNQTTGAYYDQCLIKKPAQSAQDQGLRTQLWDYSLEAVGLAADTFSVPAQSSS
jgi:retinol dehydrogenase-12